MAGLQRPRPTDSGRTTVAGEPRSCPHCGSEKLREVAQTEYVVYLTCEQCSYLVTLSTPHATVPKTT
jgi:transcription elongation factor Elf1